MLLRFCCALGLVCWLSPYVIADDVPPPDSAEWTEILARELPFLPRPLVELTAWDSEMTVQELIEFIQREHEISVIISDRLKEKDSGILERKIGVGVRRRPLYQALDDLRVIEVQWDHQNGAILLIPIEDDGNSTQFYDVRALLKAGWSTESIESMVRWFGGAPDDDWGYQDAVQVRGPVASFNGRPEARRLVGQVLNQFEKSPLPFVPGQTSRDAALDRLIDRKMNFHAEDVTWEELGDRLSRELYTEVSIHPNIYESGRLNPNQRVSFDLQKQSLKEGLQTAHWGWGLTAYAYGGRIVIEQIGCPTRHEKVFDIENIAPHFPSTDELVQLILDASDLRGDLSNFGGDDETVQVPHSTRLLVSTDYAVSISDVERCLQQLKQLVRTNPDWKAPDDVVLRVYDIHPKLKLDEALDLIPKLVEPGTWHVEGESEVDGKTRIGSIGALTVTEWKRGTPNQVEPNRKLLVQHRRSVHAKVKKCVKELERVASPPLPFPDDELPSPVP